MNRADVWTNRTLQKWVSEFWVLDIKDTAVPALLSLRLLTLCEASAVSRGYSSCPLQDPCGEAQRLFPKLALSCQSCQRATVEVETPAPMKTSNDCTRGQPLNHSLRRDQNYPPQLLPNSWPTETTRGDKCFSVVKKKKKKSSAYQEIRPKRQAKARSQRAFGLRFYPANQDFFKVVLCNDA